MTKTEFATFAMALKTYYPREQILPNQQAMELWYRELQDIPMQVAEATLRKWVSTNKWSPSIAEIRETAANIQNGEVPDWSEGWEQVIRAIRRHGYYDPKGALESLDPLTRECVKRLGFRELCLSENPVADRANFRTCYETLQKREQTKQQLALPLQSVIEKLRIANNDMLQIGAGGNNE